MSKDIRLYIANRRVDIPEGVSLPITYQTEDFNNPTIVKNSFSKTIALPGTKNNNTIFGEIYKLDRMQHYEEWTGNPQLNGINFDPSKRVDFAIYRDSDLMESGYMQLNDIAIDGENITYNITLYGGVGDFFYGLKYKEDGTTKTLADIRYFIKDSQGNLLPEETEMDFIANKEFVSECFDNNYNTDTETLKDTITFMPAYNGLYEDFDSSHCLINTTSQSVFPTTKTEDNVTYNTYNGYGLANLDHDYTEWEMKDLRSYRQRPAIKVSKLIKAICREENSGYNVEFDEKFFNDRNPYWDKTFVALPLLTSNELEESSYDLDSVTKETRLLHISGHYGDSKFPTAEGPIGLTGTDVTTSSGVVSFTGPTGSTMNLTIDFQLKATAAGNAGERDLYLWYKRNQYANYMQYGAVYLVVKDADTDTVLGYSSGYQFEHDTYDIGGETFIVSTPENAAMAEVPGRFVRANNGDYYFTSWNGGNTWRLILSNCPTARRMKVELVTRWYQNSNQQVDPQYYNFILAPSVDSYNGYSFYAETMVDSTSEGSITISGAVTSGMHITKQLFLKTEKSPADFLLDYTKLFGLYFIKDVGSKTIKICSRNTFFTGKINDWSDRIDYSKNVTITPILFDKKFYLMSRDTPETKVSKRYKSQYDQEYGQKRIGTGYNFNFETQKLYDDNLYQSVVPMLNSDKYYRSFFDNEDTPVPAFLVDNCTYNLYDSAGETVDIDMLARDWVASSATIEWNDLGKDFWPKNCYFTSDGDSEQLQEISSALVMFNGRRRLTDSEGWLRNVWLTDDLAEMYYLNDGEPCYLYTATNVDEDGNVIAIAKQTLPQFTNCIFDSSYNITASLDFGQPKEIYMGNYAYQDSVTIYDNFWKNFYTDQFNIDTKKVTCFVKLDYMNQERLRDFYYFDNAIWVLNKVDSYDVCSDNTVRCEFIKCQDVNNYTSGQKTY